MIARDHPVTAAITEVLRSPRLTAALAVTGIAASVLSYAAPRLIGIAGYVAAIATLALLMGLSMLARRDEIEIRGLLPVSLLAFLGWCSVSVIWSWYQWLTLGRLTVLAGITAIGLFVALSRDTIQVARAFGDVSRVVLVASLVLEVFSGILIDTPIPFLGISGQLADLGPISGLLGTRNHLGLLAVIGAITFTIEARTRSVRRPVWMASLGLAGLVIALTRSPVVWLVAGVVGVAAGVLWAIRHAGARQRRPLQLTALAVAAVILGFAWILRGPLVRLANAQGELGYRLDLWRQVLALLPANNIEGFGWVGAWPRDIYPYSTIETIAERPAGSSLNAYLDVWLQVGVVGLAMFIGMLGLAFTRSWLLAGRRRSVTYAWPAGVLVALLTTSLAESSILTDFGWVAFVICCVKASQELSWRNALLDAPPGPPT